MSPADGATQQSVHGLAGNPNAVLVLNYFGSVDEARSYFANLDLLDAMERGGVQGRAQIESFE